MFLHKARFA